MDSGLNFPDIAMHCFCLQLPTHIVESVEKETRGTPYFLRKTYGHSAWTSGARPSVTGTFALKQCSRIQSASEHAIFIHKIEKFSREMTLPPP